ncbi:SMI1/KNR4 family protein [Myxococcota bacterium]|nr:SMI1/KNR4 family protein [Myxococcota bacterium]MBU1498301.1 SMI1/KNR4 family protein [Myxococcota bacterium]
MMIQKQLSFLLSKFPFSVPVGYKWIIMQSLAGFEPNSALQPWYFLPYEEIFLVNERWPFIEEHTQLYSFARRQDCDDLACFSLIDGILQPNVVVVHAWTPEGFEVSVRFKSFWDWLRNVVNDIEDWVEMYDKC